MLWSSSHSKKRNLKSLIPEMSVAKRVVSGFLRQITLRKNGCNLTLVLHYGSHDGLTLESCGSHKV
jgi:hypothetical protein